MFIVFLLIIKTLYKNDLESRRNVYIFRLNRTKSNSFSGFMCKNSNSDNDKSVACPMYLSLEINVRTGCMRISTPITIFVLVVYEQITPTIVTIPNREIIC